jgi:hypothetical protein
VFFPDTEGKGAEYLLSERRAYLVKTGVSAYDKYYRPENWVKVYAGGRTMVQEKVGVPGKVFGAGPRVISYSPATSREGDSGLSKVKPEPFIPVRLLLPLKRSVTEFSGPRTWQIFSATTTFNH